MFRLPHQINLFHLKKTIINIKNISQVINYTYINHVVKKEISVFSMIFIFLH
ncbi:hypothetical protein CKO_00424 [Citrobacter koseri ATCC BAA-895]|uniref:Uncharacterized protein n=1 Tax=Citrobacter koseri (strain ATCC BAA-895 / CDC 4225-83 / SGSC4696) TaxID=290338 RepID=A8ADL8_CITK8|nr:hypothetical protein CKO_00424 [Citrobacter koseri ATCC BAA-895]